MNVIVNGNAYSDDGSSSRDFRNGGHLLWLFPLLSDVMTVMSGAVIGPESAAEAVAAAQDAADAAAEALGAVTAATGAAGDAGAALAAALQALAATRRHAFLAGGAASAAARSAESAEATVAGAIPALEAAAAAAVVAFTTALGIPAASSGVAGRALVVNAAGSGYEHGPIPVSRSRAFFVGGF